MHLRKCRSAGRIGLIGVLSAVILMASSQASIADESANSVDSLVESVSEVAPNENVLTVDESGSGDLEAAPEGAELTLPADGGEQLTIETEDGAEFQLGLPTDVDGVEAGVAEDGSVVYKTTEAVDVVAQVIDDGVRIMSVISDGSAPSTYDYEIDGLTPVLQVDGSVFLFEPTEPATEPVGIIDAPWAKDARGNDVPTQYVVEGTTVVQVVDHLSGDYAYPIVADPKLTFGKRIYWNLTRKEQQYFFTMGSAGAAAYLCAQTAGLGCGVAAAAASGIGVFLSNRGGICPKSKSWLQIGLPYGYPLNKFPGPSIACKSKV